MSANAQTLGSQQPAATTTSANIGGKRGATVRTADVAAKGGMPWTEAEERLLVQFRDPRREGGPMGYKEIGEALDRSALSCRIKVHKRAKEAGGAEALVVVEEEEEEPQVADTAAVQAADQAAAGALHEVVDESAEPVRARLGLIMAVNSRAELERDELKLAKKKRKSFRFRDKVTGHRVLTQQDAAEKLIKLSEGLGARLVANPQLRGNSTAREIEGLRTYIGNLPGPAK